MESINLTLKDFLLDSTQKKGTTYKLIKMVSREKQKQTLSYKLGINLNTSFIRFTAYVW